VIGRLLLAVPLTLWAPACAKKESDSESVAQPAPTGIDIDDPRACAPCHQAIVAEWNESMHARAHHDRDPIYAGIRALRLGKEGAQIAPACAGCHNPRTDELEGTVAKRGVSCATCHNVAAIHAGKSGRAALQWAEGSVLTGPHDASPEGTTAHGTGPAAPHLTDGKSMCLVCHAEVKSKAGLPICTTGPERAAAPEDDQTCVSCHMPTVDGPSGAFTARKTHRSHIFAGPHRAWYQADPGPLKRAVTLTGTWDKSGLTLRLGNATGHGFPSGFPGRQSILKTTGHDAAGAPIWSPPPVVLGKRYEDAAGQPTLAPWAEKLAKDTRLKPAEKRDIVLTPPDGVVRVETSLSMRLLPAKLAQKLKLNDKPEGEPRVIHALSLKKPE
jgi:hypothetical protein